MFSTNKSSFVFGPTNTYSGGTPVDINPEDLSKSERSYTFVDPISGIGSSPITDYVPKSIGGTFDALIGYTTQLIPTDPKHLTTKKYVDDAIAAGVSGTIDWTLARAQVSSAAGTPLTYASATGIFTLNKALSNYTNDAGFKTTVSQADVTQHQAALSIATSQIPGFAAAITAGVASSFTALYAAAIALTSLADLGTKTHSSLTGLAGSADGYHLSSSQFTTATQAASALTDGYLTALDWAAFTAKLNSFTPGTGIDFDGDVISVNNSEIINDAGTSAIDIWSAEQIIAYTTAGLNVYTIRLNAGTSLAQRLSGLIEGTDYPTGWVLTASGASLVITHSLDMMCTIISTLSVNGITSDAVKLEGNIAFSTFTNNYYLTGYNRITLDTFNVDGTELYLKLII